MIHSMTIIRCFLLRTFSREFSRDLWMTFAGLEDDIRGSFRGSFHWSFRWSWVWSKSINQSQSIQRIIKLLYISWYLENWYIFTDAISLELKITLAGVFRWSCSVGISVMFLFKCSTESNK
jgi:hypothetical protein